MCKWGTQYLVLCVTFTEDTTEGFLGDRHKEGLTVILHTYPTRPGAHNLLKGRCPPMAVLFWGTGESQWETAKASRTILPNASHKQVTGL